MVVFTIIEILCGMILLVFYGIILFLIASRPEELSQHIWSNLLCFLTSTAVTGFYWYSLVKTLRCLYRNKETYRWLTKRIRMLTKAGDSPEMLEPYKQDMELIDGFYEAISMAGYFLRRHRYVLRRQIQSEAEVNQWVGYHVRKWYELASHTCPNTSKQHGYNLGLLTTIKLFHDAHHEIETKKI